MQNIVRVVEAALKKADCELRSLAAIAFTQSPGLIGSLLVGSQFAKSLAQALDIPLLAVHPMQGQLLANLIPGRAKPRPAFPFFCLPRGGGPRPTVLCQSPFPTKVAGATSGD